MVFEFLSSGEERQEAARERRGLEQKIQRIKYQYREGDVGQREYGQKMALTKAALAAVQEAEDVQLVTLGNHVEGLLESWPIATLIATS